ncbi:MAG: DUF2752 domain-containing protein [Planctomycetota bacterium]|nr:MAG: DUF2752 domain-containing protein [Planctomycetota bacterium]
MKTNKENLSQGPAFFKNRILIILVTVGILSVSFFLSGVVLRGPVICMSHGLAGLPCPACGLTRGFCALADLDIVGAIESNALCIPLFLLFIIAPLVAAWEMISRRRLKFYRFMYSMKLAYILGGALALYHIGRCACWIANGSFVNQYIKTSWTYSLFFQ